jgi:hypothetical protein
MPGWHQNIPSDYMWVRMYPGEGEVVIVPRVFPRELGELSETKLQAFQVKKLAGFAIKLHPVLGHSKGWQAGSQL